MAVVGAVRHDSAVAMADHVGGDGRGGSRRGQAEHGQQGKGLGGKGDLRSMESKNNLDKCNILSPSSVQCICGLIHMPAPGDLYTR